MTIKCRTGTEKCSSSQLDTELIDTLVAEELKNLFSGSEEDSRKTEAKTKTAEKASKEEKTISLEDVRAVMADKSRKGYTAEVKALLTKRGVNKLSDINPKDCAKEKDKPSEFAMQGIDAHTLCEHKLKLALGQQSKDPTEDLTFFDEEMADCTDMYAQYVME